MGAFWKVLGKSLVWTAKGAIVAARWCSEHPEVAEAIARAAGKPKLADAIHKATTPKQAAKP